MIYLICSFEGTILLLKDRGLVKWYDRSLQNFWWEFDSLIPCYKKTACLRGFFVPYCILVCCIIHISHNDLPEFHSTALSSIDDATASPHSAALQTENSFCVIMLKVNETVH